MRWWAMFTLAGLDGKERWEDRGCVVMDGRRPLLVGRSRLIGGSSVHGSVLDGREPLPSSGQLRTNA